MGASGKSSHELCRLHDGRGVRHWNCFRISCTEFDTSGGRSRVECVARVRVRESGAVGGEAAEFALGGDGVDRRRLDAHRATDPRRPVA